MALYYYSHDTDLWNALIIDLYWLIVSSSINSIPLIFPQFNLHRMLEIIDGVNTPSMINTYYAIPGPLSLYLGLFQWHGQFNRAYLAVTRAAWKHDYEYSFVVFIIYIFKKVYFLSSCTVNSMWRHLANEFKFVEFFRFFLESWFFQRLCHEVLPSSCQVQSVGWLADDFTMTIYLSHIVNNDVIIASWYTS
jgi:hypothetical protein